MVALLFVVLLLGRIGDVLQHLGIEPGDQIDYQKLPGRAIRIRVVQPQGSIEGFIGLLESATSRILSLEEINEISAVGWARQQ